MSFIMFKCYIIAGQWVTVDVVSFLLSQSSLAYQRCPRLHHFAFGLLYGKVPDGIILPVEISAVIPRVVSSRFFEPNILLVLHQFEQDLLTHNAASLAVRTSASYCACLPAPEGASYP